MKFVLLILCLTGSAFACASDPGINGTKTPAQEAWHTVQTINRLWAITEDMDSLGLFVHDQMILISPGGVVQGKEQILESYRQYAQSAETIYFLESEPFIQLYNDNQTAVVSYNSDLKIKNAEGKIQSFRCRDMYTLIFDKNRWIAVAQHYSFY